MRKETFVNNLKYQFDPTKMYNKYLIEGETKWRNHGDYCEFLAKSVLGLTPNKDANTRSDKGHDIPEFNASVKSWNCGLSDRKDLKGLGFEEFTIRFFNDEPKDTVYIWVHDYGEMVDLYFLSMEEMIDFTIACAKYYEYEAKVRFKMCENKIVKYLDEKCA